MEKDVVCGMMVKPEEAPAKSDYQNKTYYFCDVDCKEAFDKEPEKYLKRVAGVVANTN